MYFISTFKKIIIKLINILCKSNSIFASLIKPLDILSPSPAYSINPAINKGLSLYTLNSSLAFCSTSAYCLLSTTFLPSFSLTKCSVLIWIFLSVLDFFMCSDHSSFLNQLHSVLLETPTNFSISLYVWPFFLSSKTFSLSCLILHNTNTGVLFYKIKKWINKKALEFVQHLRSFATDEVVPLDREDQIDTDSPNDPERNHNDAFQDKTTE